MRKPLALVLTLFVLLAFPGCDTFTLEFSEPAGQFEAATLPLYGEKYVRKKVSVRGVVTRHDTTDPDNLLVYLTHGVCCNFGKNKRALEKNRVGAMAYVDGILRRCLPNDILITPAIPRDPTAEFVPTTQ